MTDPAGDTPNPPQDPSPTPPPASAGPPPQTPPAAQPVNYAGPATGYPGPYAGPAPKDEEKTLSLVSHILNVTVLAPLLIWLLKKDGNPFIDDQGKESLNFSLSCLIVHVICMVLACLFFPALISLALMITQIVLGIIGGLQAKDGVAYRYPLNFRMIT